MRRPQVVRETHCLYITRGGAKSVARTLNQRGLRYRTGIPWNQNLVRDEEANIGTYR